MTLDADMDAGDFRPAGHRRGRAHSASDMVYERLRESVISLELPPETALSRTDLCQRYGVSQTPVREAILRLEREGLVRSFPQSRTVITRIDVGQLREAHFLRAALELEIARSLARIGDPDLVAGAGAILERQRALGADAARQAEFARLDRAFHDALYLAAGHGAMAELVRERSGHLDRLRRLHLPSPGKMAAIVVEHGRILDAIRTGCPERAEEAVRRHLSGTMAMIDDLIAADPDYFTGR